MLAGRSTSSCLFLSLRRAHDERNAQTGSEQGTRSSHRTLPTQARHLGLRITGRQDVTRAAYTRQADQGDGPGDGLKNTMMASPALRTQEQQLKARESERAELAKLIKSLDEAITSIPTPAGCCPAM